MTRIKAKIEKWVVGTAKLEKSVLVHPKELENGDYSLIVSPEEAAEVVAMLEANKIEEVERAVAVGRFVNIFLSKHFFADSVNEINKEKENFGKSDLFEGEKIFVEHTQPNPFKEFHIGHLMNNAIGESVARILKANGAEVKTCSYHGDVGLHVAKAIWELLQSAQITLITNANQIGKAYFKGAALYEKSPSIRKEIDEINKKIYNKTDQKINEVYEKGRKISLDQFQSIYRKLDSHFDENFFESETGEIGKNIIKENTNKIFEESEGAVVFRGENFEPKTHTRVFLNKEGLPTYEAKEVGLVKLKVEKFGDYDQSITVTGNEQDSFFDVVEVAIGQIFENLKGKLKHLSHGMLRLPSGKMSSRTGDVITAESLIEQVRERVLEKIKDREYAQEEKNEISEVVAIGAIKYSILRQAIGGDIVFDFEKSISFEGDSGPYLQYTAVRAKSVLEKSDLTPGPSPRLSRGERVERPENFQITEVEKLLYRFPEVVERAGKEHAPHHLVTYLTELASAFNSFYGNTKIIDVNDPASSYKLALTQAVAHTLRNGLNILGIKVPEKM